MSLRRIDVFFYGLFMDIQVLHDAGTKPSNLRRAYVTDFALRIGKRATLIPSPGARAYGMLVALTHSELESLYNAPGLEVYHPEAIIAYPSEGEATPALCYNLLQTPKPDEQNLEYAADLQSVLRNLGFPIEYVESVR